MSVQKAERLWSVYKHTSPSGKVYIGAAKDIKHRWRGHGNGYRGSTGIWDAIQKYGWENIDHEVVASDLTQEEAWDMETQLIDEYDSTNPSHGYNLTTGGRRGRLSQLSVARLSASQMGHPVSEKVRYMLAESNSYPIICLETKEVFENSQEAADKLNLCRTSILKAANGKQDTCGGLHFARLSDYDSGQVKRFVHAPSRYHRVRCIDTGEEFVNVSDASKMTGLSRRAISYACNGVHETCGGMRWEFIRD